MGIRAWLLLSVSLLLPDHWTPGSSTQALCFLVNMAPHGLESETKLHCVAHEAFMAFHLVVFILLFNSPFFAFYTIQSELLTVSEYIMLVVCLWP